LAEGIFGDGGKPIPEAMLLYGVGIGVVLLIADFFLERKKSGFRLHVMPVAVGIYLSLGLTIPILIGGLLHFVVSRKAGDDKDRQLKRGVLLASGVIAGESLIGVLLGFLAWQGMTGVAGDMQSYGRIFGTLQVPGEGGAMVTALTRNGEVAMDIVSLVVLFLVAVWMYRKSKQRAT
jgi:hypothetical protein